MPQTKKSESAASINIPSEPSKPAERFVTVKVVSLPLTVNVQVPHGSIAYSREMIGITQGSIEVNQEIRVRVLEGEEDFDAVLRFYEELTTRLLAIHARVINKSIASASEIANAISARLPNPLAGLATGEI